MIPNNASKEHSFEGKPRWLSELANAPPVEWLWYGRIPKGHLTILEGPPGQGKTMLLLDIASRISRAQPLPDVPPEKCSARMQRTLILSAEDDPSTLRCRVIAAGGDCTSIGVVEDLMVFPNHGEVLLNMVLDYHVDLVIVDPINSYLSPAINSHNDQETRRGLHPLREVARLVGCSVVLVRHLNKSNSGPAINRGMGSIAFSGLARTQLQLVPHDSGFALARAKGNLSKPPMALPFTIEGDEESPRIVWGEPMAGTADELLMVNTGVEKTNADELCANFIEKKVIENGAMLSNALRDLASHHGWKGGTYKRAQQLVKNKGITPFQENGQWMMGFKTPFDS